MRIINNLVFYGDCREAFARYAEVLGGDLKELISFGETPQGDMPWSDRDRDLIMHVWLQIGDQAIMGCDSPGEKPSEKSGFSVALFFDCAAEAERIFDTLVDGGAATMPFQQTFWSKGFGMLTDRFGTPWLINTQEAETAGQAQS